MPTPPSSNTIATDAVQLAPRPWVGLGVTALGAPLLVLAWPAALVVSLFGLFLLLQTALLRLRFDADALVVLRGSTEIRRFPYSSWISWRLFWPAVPVIFYFRETNSIHLLPMLFDARTLEQQLRLRVGPNGTNSTAA